MLWVYTLSKPYSQYSIHSGLSSLHILITRELYKSCWTTHSQCNCTTVLRRSWSHIISLHLLSSQLSSTIKSSNQVFGSSFRVHYSLFVTTSHTLSSVALHHRLTSPTAPPAFYTVACCLLPVACVNSGVACYVTVGSAGVGGWGVDLPVTVAAAALFCYVIAGGRRGVLHSANTSQYVCMYFLYIIFFSLLVLLIAHWKLLSEQPSYVTEK
jgi:hypothetical protein